MCVSLFTGGSYLYPWCIGPHSRGPQTSDYVPPGPSPTPHQTSDMGTPSHHWGPIQTCPPDHPTPIPNGMDIMWPTKRAQLASRRCASYLNAFLLLNHLIVTLEEIKLVLLIYPSILLSCCKWILANLSSLLCVCVYF